MNDTQMSRSEIRKVFKRHRGAAAQLAAVLDKSRTTVSLVLRGRSTSQDVLEAARKMAEDLTSKEGEAA